MNAPHKDIDKIIPFGEFLRGFINQRYITATDNHSIYNRLLLNIL